MRDMGEPLEYSTVHTSLSAPIIEVMDILVKHGMYSSRTEIVRVALLMFFKTMEYRIQ